MNIGLIREFKEPADKRVALSPKQCAELLRDYPEIKIFIEPSPARAIPIEDYLDAGVLLGENMELCDLLLGIKEVPIDQLIAGKTYMFFSHTIKAQDYNRKLLQNIVNKRIKLIDYETLVWPQGGRILGFGKWAGIVGTYNAFLTWGTKTGRFELPPAYKSQGFEQCMDLLKFIHPGPVKIAYTGTGRVAAGIREVLDIMGIKEWSKEDFLNSESEEPVFTQLDNQDIYERIDGSDWDTAHFYENHEAYRGKFKPFLSQTDILINGMYWEDDMPPLFTKEDTAKADFRIKVIADITCDVEGSVPITMEATDIYHPTFGWSKSQQKQVEPFGEDTIDIMAVTNLPTELPVNASEEFGALLKKHVLPLIIEGDKDDIIKNATITEGGKLTNEYAYLQDFIDAG
ncbi:alanine dehydrogenase [bacterium]|nr:alanine dehydrogenase [bacterium]